MYLPLLQKLISYASLSRKDIVLEVGAGLGTLTKLLSQKCKKVVAVEIDARLIKILRKELKGFENVVLIEGDILEVSLPPFNKLVSTPPYSLSSPLLFWLLDRDFECGVLTFQEELAQRLVAEEGSKEYGRLTVNTHYQAEVELLDQVPSYMFYPQPDVTSRIVKLKPREPPFHVKDETVFFELVRTLFTQRNKKVRNAIIPFLRKRQITGKEARAFADSLPFHDRRVQRLAPEDFGLLANEIVQRESANISFGDCTLLVSNDVYTPAEDTFLIAQNLEVGNGDMVLDMGTGCGILAVLAAKRAQRVVAVDVNPHAIECARINAKQNQGLEKMDIRLGDLFTPVKEGERFDVILFNPPYLPSKTSETWIEKAWSGGPTGRELIDRFISEASLYLRGGGRIYMIQSSLSNIDETIQRLEKAGFRAYIAAEMKVAFERIVLIKAENYSPGDRKEV
ncbi:ribosomal RNA small subunit methyltransferase A [Candidatus Bathyarchaeota archaeon]|nr:ribosomal RNA small subunit methyltransferase A [Candidatus Bathyarchaeota archaeon]NIU81839.1 ribosomal RNA small subunit methyltransferase A [Candidatus Bathyarchaeota archaeon]NIW34980.1 ribosomal RNA small subunit methyltransferase A [Candidatus Bathyarchaeota archaeon]